jgi:hypothetical protein
MSSERQSNTPDWKQSLLQWEQSGGSTEAKEDLLWQKLQEKLQPKKKKRGAYIIRAAAAVLILLALSLFFVLRKNGIPEKKEVVKVPSPESTVKKDQLIVVKENKSVSNSPIIVKQEIAPVAVKEKKEMRLTPIQDEKIKEVVDPLQPSIVSIEPEKTIIENKISDTPVVAKAIAPKRKLRVVHMNELNAPPPPTYASLKEEWRPAIEPESENITTAPSIWPGKNKPKPSISLGN